MEAARELRRAVRREALHGTEVTPPLVRRINEHEADAHVQSLKARLETPEVVA